MGEFEIKYTFNNVQAPTLAAWLQFNCRPDKDYPISRVQSIYLECMDGSSYAEKINSDFLKTKHRVRWYEEVPENSMAGKEIPLFLEIKSKIGSQRRKNRKMMHLSLDKIRKAPLSAAYHQRWKIFFNELGSIRALEPYIQISYLRNRYIDPLTDTRLSLDYNIIVERSNTNYLPVPCFAELAQGVFEIKGSRVEPPQSLGYLTRNLARKTSFSKYERCVSQLLSE